MFSNGKPYYEPVRQQILGMSSSRICKFVRLMEPIDNARCLWPEGNGHFSIITSIREIKDLIEVTKVTEDGKAPNITTKQDYYAILMVDAIDDKRKIKQQVLAAGAPKQTEQEAVVDLLTVVQKEMGIVDLFYHGMAEYDGPRAIVPSTLRPQSHSKQLKPLPELPKDQKSEESSGNTKETVSLESMESSFCRMPRPTREQGGDPREGPMMPIYGCQIM